MASKFEQAWNFWIQAKAKTWNVPPDLVKAVITVESNWNPKAEGDVWRDNWAFFKTPHSFGLMQIQLATAKEIAGLDKQLTKELLLKPKINISIGTQYLAKQKKRFGTWEKAVAAYNAGSPRYKRGRFINQGYVDKVNEAYKGYTGRYLYTPQKGGNSVLSLRLLLLAPLGLFFLSRDK